MSKLLRYTLLCLVASALSSPLLGCSDLTAPGGENPSELRALPPHGNHYAPAGKTATIAASHILVAYQGATRASPKITRTKQEAAAEAAKLAALAKAPGADFEALAREHSDDLGSGRNGGRLGTFAREGMTRKFSDAAFALTVGQVSDVVETEFGFHVIKRTK